MEEFLAGIKMEKYKDIFLANGFEDLETILELREEDFNVMGIPLGHKLKILKHIKELKPAEAKPAPQAQSQLHGMMKSTGSAKNVYEELPETSVASEAKISPVITKYHFIRTSQKKRKGSILQ